MGEPVRDHEGRDERDAPKPQRPSEAEVQGLSDEELDEVTEEVAARTLGLVQATLIAVAVVALAATLLVYLIA
jgi:hypothetical protein